MVYAVHILARYRFLIGGFASFLLAFAIPSSHARAQQALQETALGDEMIDRYLAAKAEALSAESQDDLTSREDWVNKRATLREEYLYMLGLWPLPERTPLNATITGVYDGHEAGHGFVVDNLFYQSKPGLYVTANLYRPAKIEAGEKLPAVLYVCGHSGRGRSGNKTAFQSHGAWFARHGYICLVVDTLQLGEIGATHHGTYNLGRWWWHSRGYTPAGVECWNGVRGIDYLLSRPDVDPARIAVTGISGGGAATFWIAAADDRVAIAAPVSGMADLPSYVGDRVINGHCDCMFLYNTFQWPWTRIAALIAPRPMLFVNSDNDPIFPMDANERISNSLERLYSLFGASDSFDTVVSVGGHAYRQDLRQAIFRFTNSYLKNDPRSIADSEELLISGPREDGIHPIPIEELRVFPADADLPRDELNTTIDEHFVPLADFSIPDSADEFAAWKEELLAELRRVSLRGLPNETSAATLTETLEGGNLRLNTEPGIVVRLLSRNGNREIVEPQKVLLAISGEAAGDKFPDWASEGASASSAQFILEPRGTGETRWTKKNPPNYVERSHALLGETVDAGRIRDIVATVRYLEDRYPQAEIVLAGEGASALLAAYAGLFGGGVDALILRNPSPSHNDAAAPQLLNVLRVCDAPQVFGMFAPAPLTLIDANEGFVAAVRQAYVARGAEEKLSAR